MTQMSVNQIGLLMEAVDPFMHVGLLAGLLLVLFELVVLLGDLIGSGDRAPRR